MYYFYYIGYFDCFTSMSIFLFPFLCCNGIAYTFGKCYFVFDFIFFKNLFRLFLPSLMEEAFDRSAVVQPRIEVDGKSADDQSTRRAFRGSRNCGMFNPWYLTSSTIECASICECNIAKPRWARYIFMYCLKRSYPLAIR